jgi:hypothetical protein
MAGSSGEISYPQYLTDMHKHIMVRSSVAGLNPWTSGGNALEYSLFHFINTATLEANSPYYNETAFDPTAAQAAFSTTSPLGRIKTSFDETKTLIDAVSATNNWDSYITKAATKTGVFADINFLDGMATAIEGLLTAIENAMASSVIDDMVLAFENKKKARVKREISQWSAGMADINAVHTSSFVWGQMMLEKDFADSIDAYEAELKNNLFNTILHSSIDSYLKANVLRVSSQDDIIKQGTAMMGELGNYKLQLQTQLTQIKTGIEQLTIVAGKEQTDENLHIDVQDALWDLEATMYGANMLAAIAGAPAGRKEHMSKGRSALSGAMTGASVGAMIPGPPGVAPAIGAITGGLAGYFLE